MQRITTVLTKASKSTSSCQKVVSIPIVENQTSSVLNMGVIGDGTNTDFLNLHIGSGMFIVFF